MRVLREGEDRGPAVVVAAERSEEGTRRIVDRTVPLHGRLLPLLVVMRIGRGFPPLA